MNTPPALPLHRDRYLGYDLAHDLGIVTNVDEFTQLEQAAFNTAATADNTVSLAEASQWIDWFGDHPEPAPRPGQTLTVDEPDDLRIDEARERMRIVNDAIDRSLVWPRPVGFEPAPRRVTEYVGSIAPVVTFGDASWPVDLGLGDAPTVTFTAGEVER
jgi:hypothetical protein